MEGKKKKQDRSWFRKKPERHVLIYVYLFVCVSDKYNKKIISQWQLYCKYVCRGLFSCLTKLCYSHSNVFTFLFLYLFHLCSVFCKYADVSICIGVQPDGSK